MLIVIHKFPNITLINPIIPADHHLINCYSTKCAISVNINFDLTITYLKSSSNLFIARIMTKLFVHIFRVMFGYFLLVYIFYIFSSAMAYYNVAFFAAVQRMGNVLPKTLVSFCHRSVSNFY